jgi:hypothetical protein
MKALGIYPDSKTYDAIRRYARLFRNSYVYRVCTPRITGTSPVNEYVRRHRGNPDMIDAIMRDLACKIGFFDGFDLVAERIASAELTALVVNKFGSELPPNGILYAIHLSAELDANWGGDEITDEHLNWYFLLVTSRGLQYVATLSREELYAVA